MKTRSIGIIGLLVATAYLWAANAAAVTIDFEGLPSTTVCCPNQVPNPASVLTDDFKGAGVIFGRAGLSAGVAVVDNSFAPSSGVLSAAGLDANGIIPGSVAGGAAVGDIYFKFVLATTTIPADVNSVSFTIGDSGGDVDEFEIRAYDLNDMLISTQNVSNVVRFTVNINVMGIHRVEVDFTGDFGYSLDDLTFNPPVVGTETVSWGHVKSLFR